MFLVSEEGSKIYTQRILLSFYSSKVHDIIESFPRDMIGISVPASSVSIAMLLKVLTTGSVIASQKMDLMDVGLAAEVLGVVLKNKQIGFEVKNLAVEIQVSRDNSNFEEEISQLVHVACNDLVLTNMDEESSDILIGGSSELDYPKGTEVLEISLSEVKDSPVKKIEMESTSSVGNDKERETCEVCGKSLLKKNLVRHMEVHEDVRQKTFKCNIQKVNLKVHKMKRHQDMESQDQPATVQPQPTAEQIQLVQEAEALPCGDRESYKDYNGNEPEHEDEEIGCVVDQNMAAACNEGNKDSVVPPVDKPDELYNFCLREETGERKWICSICYEYSSNRSYSVRNHVESKHYPNTFQYFCDKCDKICHTKNALSCHNYEKHRALKIPK